MSFSIFASGSPDFHYSKDDCLDDSAFDTIDLLAKLQTMEPTWMGAGATAIDIAQPSAGIVDLMKTMATMEFLHNLSNAVCFLAMCSGSANGWISVSAVEKHWYWPDTGDTKTYRFDPGDSPGAEFIKKIGPALKAANMAHWGALRMMGMVLAKYSSKIGDNATPIINISLTS